MLSEFFNVEPIDWAYWSLFVEIKFYVLIAIILFAGKISWTQHILIAWLAASIYLEFIYRNGHLYYWLNVNYAAYFIAGAACFLIYTKGLSWSRVVIIAIAWGLAVAQLGSDIMYREKHFKTPVNDLLIAGIITAFFLIMLLISMRKTGIMGRIRWSGIGMLTYPLYLLHQNVGFMIFNAAHPAVDTHVLFWGVILLMIAMAYIISRLEAGISPLLGKALNRSSIPENKSM
jgi:peptidoglycan/LPS O-acetylase OafA/YrhL